MKFIETNLKDGNVKLPQFVINALKLSGGELLDIDVKRLDDINLGGDYESFPDIDELVLPESVLRESCIEKDDDRAFCGDYGRIEVVGMESGTDIDEVVFENLKININGLKYTLFENIGDGYYADEDENILHVPEYLLADAKIDEQADLRVYIFEKDVLIVEEVC